MIAFPERLRKKPRTTPAKPEPDTESTQLLNCCLENEHYRINLRMTSAQWDELQKHVRENKAKTPPPPAG